jgi:hypothetical protein
MPLGSQAVSTPVGHNSHLPHLGQVLRGVRPSVSRSSGEAQNIQIRAARCQPELQQQPPRLGGSRVVRCRP